MARNSPLRAAFFATASGVVTPKARPVLVATRRAVFARDGWRCGDCGQPVLWLRPRLRHRSETVGHVDHIFPRARGGQNDMGNLRLLCEPCNESKAAD